MSISSLLRMPIDAFDNYRSNHFMKEQYRDKMSIAHYYLNKNPLEKLTTSQIKEIDTYWEQYGIRFRDYSWFQLYYGITGITDPRFISQDVYSYIIWPYYNNEQFCMAWKDKNLFERFCPSVPFPHNYLRKINGRYFDENGSYVPDREQVISILQNIGMGGVIVKDSWDSGEGRGVKKYVIECRDDAEKLLKDWEKSDNLLVQELLHQNHVFSQFNESSVNIMRINSWRNGNNVVIFSPTLRIGTAGQTTDICYIDGIEIANVCAITLDGRFADKIVNQFGIAKNTDDVIPEPDAVIPRWDEIIEIVKEGHRQLDHFDIIGWDFTVTADKKIVCIEYNIKRPGTVFYQYVNGPFFGEYTDDILLFLKNKENQKKLIPEWIRV